MANVLQETKTYTSQEAYEAALEYFKGDDLAARVWVNKYALKDSDGNIYENTPDAMHWRIAKEIARIESKYPNPMSAEEVYEVIKDFKYILPQGSPMAGIGNNYQIASLSNCFVIGSGTDSDSYGSIMKIDEEQVQLMKRRGGVGHDLSNIRPKGSAVKNSALTSTGLVPFMERYSNSTREVAQDGRRGALMLSVSINHPDAEDFIDAKMEQGKVTGANVSVRIDDDFMNALKTNDDYTQKYPIFSQNPKYEQVIKPTKIWNKIIHNAWKSAEPGILFWDTIINESIPDCYADLGFETVSTNPCGEIPLCPNDSCRLLAINLYSYVNNPFTDEAEFDFELFDKHVIMAQRMMDDLIDLELEKVDKIINKIKNDPESETIKSTELNLWMRIREKCEQGRRTGLGITAEGDMLAALGICYGTDESNDFSEKLHMRLKHGAFLSSSIMAEERGAFPIWDAEREENNPFMLRIKEENPALYERLVQNGRRNIALLTIAPTGSVSILTQTTSGIEPAFMVSYMRRRKINPDDKDARVDFVDEVGDSWQEYPVFHHKFETYLIAKGYNIDEVRKMDQDQIASIIAKSPYHKATSNDVNWVKKVEMQGRVQKHIDHSISVTVNLPENVTEEMVGQVYKTAWESGCKGVTVYRDGSRSGVLVSATEKEEKKQEEISFSDNHAPQRPERLEAEVVRFQNNLEEWIAFVGMLDGRPYEIFTGRRDGFNGIPNDVKQGFILKVKSDESSRYDFQYVDRGGY